MDIMSLVDLLFVGVPEVFLAILTSLLIFEKRKFFSRENITKSFISVIAILSFIYISRVNINDITVIGYISTIVYILAFKLIFNFNWHKSIIIGLSAMYSIMTIEFLSYPVYGIIQNYVSGQFFTNRIFYSIPARLVQLLLLFLIVNFKLYMKNFFLLEIKWSELTQENKITLLTLIVHIFACLVFNFSYSDMFIKIQIHKPNIDYLNINLKVYFIQTIFLSLNTILLFARTFRYELSKNLNIEYKEIIGEYEKLLIKQIKYENELENQNSNYVLQGVLESSDEEEFQDIKKIYNETKKNLNGGVPNEKTFQNISSISSCASYDSSFFDSNS